MAAYDQAYEEGRDARLEGRSLQFNPYDPGLQLSRHDGWRDGWHAAELRMVQGMMAIPGRDK